MQDLTKRYYSISEVAKMFALNISKLRFYEDNFPTLKPTRDKGGDRKYTPADIEHLQQILDLIENDGYTLEGARKVIENRRKKMVENRKRIAQLEKLKLLLLQIKEGLNDTIIVE